MAQINTCLKRTFMIFNIFLAVMGGIIILLTCLAQVTFAKQGGEVGAYLAAFIVFYILGAGTLIFASLGAFGAHRESRGALIAFLVCVLLGTLATFRVGVQSIGVQPMITEALEETYRKMLPLNTAQEGVKSVVETQQSELHCCGLFSYTDWQGDLPPSCMCSPAEAADKDLCQDVTFHQRLFMTEKKSVYAQPCFATISYYIMLGFNVVSGMAITLAILGVLAVILSSIMIHQMRRSPTTTIIMTVPTVYTSAPPKYQELHNPPVY